MLIENLSALRAFLSEPQKETPALRKVLMVSPQHFRIAYAINPYMRGPGGQLKTVDRARALEQWEVLKATYEKLGFPVEVLPGAPDLPDMVFAANQSFTFWDTVSQTPRVLLSHMASDFREPEVSFFKDWFQQHDYRVEALPTTAGMFEGNGDALLHPGRNWVWGASGPRSAPSAYQEISTRYGLSVVRLVLRSPDFYHLDTCFSLLSPNTVAVQRDAFDQENRRMIHEAFENVIEIDRDENLSCFSGNCHSPDGQHVILQKGTKKFVRDLEKKGFTPIEVDTSEFIKAGGSVFCLKMMLF